MTAEHDDLRLALGGYVLGTLPSAERERVRAHLAECDECRAEHVRLAGLPALLATVTAAEAEAVGRTVPAADGELVDRLVAQAAGSARPSSPAPSAAAAPARAGVVESLLQRAADRRRRSRRRLQLAGAAASVTFLAAAVGGTWLATVGSVTSQATPPGATAPTAWRTFSGSDPATGVTASVRVYPSAWGSVLQVHAKGAPAGITCRLQAVGPGGTRADGATWRAGAYPPGTTVPGAVAMSPGDIQHFEILTGDGQKLVTVRA
ncbi:zf-HC2 domain-containing protein [Streptomyces sp. NPDC051987]|uniref:zf-HC2 domain-containing protein n=1 Tax=Streptomyces sp. NPDC051987 TaxID=3155808 RepID=UPI00344728E9